MVTALLLLFACTGPSKPADTDRDTDTTAPDDTAPDDTGPPVDPHDVDGDGHRSDAGDCDDGDARVYAGAADPCDGVDQDCDGEVAPAGSCGEVASLDASSVGNWVGNLIGSNLSIDEADTDYDGDGVVDVLAYNYCTTWEGTDWCNQNVMLLPGRLPEGDEVVPAAGGVVILADPGRDWLADAGTAGDFDGDGTQDLYYASVGCEIDHGSIYLLRGPMADWGTGGLTTDLAAGWWEQAEPNDCFVQSVSGGEDIDGDGLADLLTGYPDTYVIRGRSSGFAAGMSVADEVVFEGAVEGHALMPDLDGDGTGEGALVIFSPEREYYLGWLDPLIVASGTGGAPVEEASDVLASGTFGTIRLHPGRAELGDVNGDGFGDVSVFIGVPGVDEDGGASKCEGVLFGSTDLRSGVLSDHVDRMVCPEDGGSLIHSRVVADVDQDGIRDVNVALSATSSSPYGDARGCIFASSQRPATGWVMLADTRPYCFTLDTEDFPHPVAAAVDLDLDGWPEILAADPNYARGAGRITVAPGFEIPWGDSTRW